MTSLRTDRRPVSVRPARHNARETAAGLVAGLVLLALTVGLPLVLLTVAPLSAPHETPTWAALVASLTRPDDGSLLRSALVVVAWGAWAGFAVSVLVEVLSVARRRPTPRIPLLRLPQHGAASLVALVVILLGPPAATTRERPPQRCCPTDGRRPWHRSRHTRCPRPSGPIRHRWANCTAGRATWSTRRTRRR